jgi:hypothetical protein
MTELTYEEWSKQNPIDWDEIENNGSEDCLITKPLVEMVHRWEYERKLREERRKSLDAIISLEDDNCDYLDDFGETTRE